MGGTRLTLSSRLIVQHYANAYGLGALETPWQSPNKWLVSLRSMHPNYYPLKEMLGTTGLMAINQMKEA